LVADLQATIEGYERFLAEQDRQLLQKAGMSDAHGVLVEVTIPTYSNWSESLEPVFAAALDEAQRDMGRFTANWVASDAGGDALKRMMRDADIDRSEPGSFGDLFTGLVSDVVVGVVVDSVTDPTERIVARLGEEMARAEQALFASDHGFVGQLRKVKSFHEEARAQLLAGPASR
jgi:hypothetical protein